MDTGIETDVVVERLPSPRKIVPGLLVVSLFIRYIDRGNLSIAAPMIKDELKISASQLGLLFSAFFWTHVKVFAGWLVDRFDANWMLTEEFFSLVGGDRNSLDGDTNAGWTSRPGTLDWVAMRIGKSSRSGSVGFATPWTAHVISISLL